MWNKFITWLKSLFQQSPEVKPVEAAEKPKEKPVENAIIFPVMNDLTKELIGKYGDMLNAPWMFVDLDILGLKEDNPKVAARYVPEWKHYGLDYKDLISAAHAWCIMAINSVFRRLGIEGTGSAGASSLREWADPCGFVFGAALPIEHDNGNHHANLFVAWWNKAKGIAVTLDRNKNNQFNVFLTDISGSGDRVRSVPRWPKGWAHGVEISYDDLIKLYPFFKVSGSGGSTR